MMKVVGKGNVAFRAGINFFGSGPGADGFRKVELPPPERIMGNRSGAPAAAEATKPEKFIQSGFFFAPLA